MEQKTLDTIISNSTTEKYVMTELGFLPNDWDIIELGSALKLIKNGTTKKQNTEGIGFPVSRIETISDEFINPNKTRNIENLDNDDIKKFKLDIGDILVSHINSEAHLGKSAIYKGEPHDLIHGMNLLRLKTNEKVLDPYFTNFLFSLYRKKGIFISIASRAVNQASINQGKIKAIKIPAPTISEQKKIASVLLAIQNTIEKTEKVIETINSLKKSMMTYLFTYGPIPINEAGKVPLKETEAGLMPESWKILKLGDISEFKNGINFTKAQKGEKGILTVDVLNMFGRGTEISLENLYRVNKDINENYNLKENDILFVRSSLKREGVGWASLFKDSEEEVTFCGFIIRARLESKDINPEFLVNYLRTDKARENLIASSGRVAITNINQGLLGKINIPSPSFSEQEKIVKILSTIDHKIEKEENKKKTLEELFKTMINDLMTAKIRVNDLEV